MSKVLYRDKLVRTLDANGFAKFPNLSKLSRLKKWKGKGVVRDIEGRGKRENVHVVEVNGEEESGLEGDCDYDLSRLVWGDFKGRK